VIPGYGPETFYETDPDLGNEFTFDVCQYSGENANVTVDVRDPDGNTRRFTVTRRGRKAAALLTTSPTGITPYIDTDANWCSSGSDPTQLGQVTTGTFGDRAAGSRASEDAKASKMTSRASRPPAVKIQRSGRARVSTAGDSP
jgi:hypothetical protein